MASQAEILKRRKKIWFYREAGAWPREIIYFLCQDGIRISYSTLHRDLRALERELELCLE